jgi:hypothetical protein
VPVTVQLPYGGEAHSSHDFSSNSVSDPALGSGVAGAATYIQVPPGSYSLTPHWMEAPTFWGHHYVQMQTQPFNPASNDFHYDMLDGSGNVVLRVLVSGETDIKYDFYTLQGGVLTFVDTVTLTMYASPFQNFDVGLVAGATGSLTLAIAGGLRWRHSPLNHGGFGGVAQVKHRAFGDAFGTSTTAGWCQMYYAPTPTVGVTLNHFLQNANSLANTGWQGNVANVNPVPSSDANPLISANPGDISTFYRTGQSVGTTKAIRGVLGAARMLVAGTGPPNLKIAQRVGGANFVSPSFPADIAYQACGYFWATNPQTGVAYVPADIPGLEVGVQSST